MKIKEHALRSIIAEALNEVLNESEMSDYYRQKATECTNRALEYISKGSFDNLDTARAYLNDAISYVEYAMRYI